MPATPFRFSAMNAKPPPRPGDWIRPNILSLAPYRVADAAGLIKLDAMENPYVLPERLQNVWKERLASMALNRYPDPRAQALRPILREVMSIPGDMDVLLGNGSDEIIQMLMLAVGGSGRQVLSVVPGFAMFSLIAQVTGTGFVGVPLNREDFSLNTEAVLQAMEAYRPALVLIANPNNPTGNLFASRALEAIVSAAPGLVVIDEAYFPFASRHCMDWPKRYSNLLVMRTLSKVGLAGLRLGFLVGSHDWLEQIEKLRLPYNINVLTQAASVFALEHYDVFQDQARRIREERERLYAALNSREELQVFPSEANFVLFRVPSGRAEAVHASLREDGVLIKKLAGSHEYLEDCLRVTVGAPDENTSFLKALEHALTGS